MAQAAVFFTGGFETSSTTLAFSLYELALHPEIQTRLRKEILEAIESNDDHRVTYDAVRGFTLVRTLARFFIDPFVGRLLALSEYGRLGDSKKVSGIFVHRTSHRRRLQDTRSRLDVGKGNASLRIQHGTALRATILSRTTRLRPRKVRRRE